MKKCTRCKLDKPVTEFGRDSSRIDGLNVYCRSCHADRGRAYRRQKPEVVAPITKRYKDRNRELIRAQGRERNRRLRNEAINSLGGECIACGEKDLIVLQIDHVKGGGREDRERFRSGAHWNLAIVSGQVDVDALRVLCANCHVRETFKRLGYGPKD